MRAYLPGYEVVSPKNLKGVLGLLKNEPGVWKPLAGGTDLMVVFETGELKHHKFVNLWQLKDLRKIKTNKKYVTLGALTTYTDVQDSKMIKKWFPLLCRSASETGAIAIQNRGTLGGNIVNASPAADSPPALLAYDAEVELTSLEGSRWVKYVDFHKGYKHIDLKPTEILTQIRLPLYLGKLKHYYRKVGTRKAQAISKVCFAGTLKIKSKIIEAVTIGLGSVAPVPLRCHKTEEFLNGKSLSPEVVEQAKEVLLREITPISDIRSTADYRLKVTANLLEEFLCGIGSAN